jgi:hypothetical protein
MRGVTHGVVRGARDAFGGVREEADDLRGSDVDDLFL